MFSVVIRSTHQVPTVFTAGEVPVATQGIYTHLNDLIKRSLASIELPSILEPPGICRSDGKRVNEVSVTPYAWQSGCALAWDVTCCDIFAPTYTTLAATGAGLVANRAEDRQVRLYREVEATHVFIPVAI